MNALFFPFTVFRTSPYLNILQALLYNLPASGFIDAWHVKGWVRRRGNIIVVVIFVIIIMSLLAGAQSGE
jgi:hypothetical protein